jgi:deazaflavin-dependent oxidoreductase (nitroreductase family)
MLRRALTAVRVAIFRASGGRALASIEGLPMLLLTTIDRASGKQRTMPLLYVEDDGALAVAASSAGNDLDPGWYHRLVATPAVEVQTRSGVQTMRATLADGRDRPRIYDRFASGSQRFARNERITDRVIPVVLLHPLEQDAGSDGDGRAEAA